MRVPKRQNVQQQPKMSQNKSQWAGMSHNKPQRATTYETLWIKMSQSETK